MAIQRRETKSGKIRWVARWRDKGGKEHSRSFDTKREAKTFLAEVEHRAARGGDTTPSRTTVKDVYDAWLATRDIVDGTETSYKGLRDRNLVPLHNYPVRDVTPADMMEWTTQLREGRTWLSKGDEGLAESTVHTILVTVASCFKWAVQEGYIDRSPVRVPRKDKAIDPIDIPTLAEIKRTIDRVEIGGASYLAKGVKQVARPNQAVADMAQIARWAGPRVSEISGLVVGEVSLDDGLIRVRAQLGKGKNAGKRVRLKTATSKRDIPIAAALEPTLRRLTVGREPHEWLIVSSRGRPMDVSNANKVLRYAAEHEGAAGVHFHALRHFYVSSLLTAGVPVQDVAKAAGHTPETTLETYAHVLDGYESRVAAAYESPVFGGSGISAGSRHLRAVD